MVPNHGMGSMQVDSSRYASWTGAEALLALLPPAASTTSLIKCSDFEPKSHPHHAVICFTCVAEQRQQHGVAALLPRGAPLL